MTIALKLSTKEQEIKREQKAAMRRFRHNRQPKEAEEQIKFVAWMREKYPDALCWHTPNECVSIRRRVYQKRMGVVSGIPDILILWRDKKIAIEFKRQGGVLSDAQWYVVTKLHTLGWIVLVAKTAEEAIELVGIATS